MVDYNPNVPIILGQEWVPIRNQDLVFGENQASNSEVGTTFSLATATRLSNARFYLNDFVYGRFVNEGVTAAIYTRGTEDASGPIQKVVIPCTSGAITGGITFNSPATDVPTALANPGTIRQSGLVFNAASGFTAFRAQFGVMQSTYAQALAGKRIVGVTLKTQIIYDNSLTVATNDPISAPFNETIEMGIRAIASNAVLADWYLAQPYEIDAGSDSGSVPRNTDVTRTDRLGNVSLYGSTMITNGDSYPWTYEELTKFDSAFGASSVSAQVMANNLAANIPRLNFTYMALEVYYCEEQRLIWGTKVFNSGAVPLASEVRYSKGLNVVKLYDRTGASDPVLPAGDYTLTVAQADFGDNFDITDRTNTAIKLNGIRELYTLPSFNAVAVKLPTVIDDSAVGEVITSEQIVNVPQLSLHTSGGTPVTEVHPYGRQVAAQVFGTVYAEQDLHDAPVGVSTAFPWVRFYARRWGDTVVPLTISGLTTLTASTATLTPDEWDALPETLDGWKEVTLRFTTPPNMGTIGTPAFRFESTGELAGNRWEILGASAPAISGIPGNQFNLAPAAQQLYNATYSPPNGINQELTWMPQGIGSPFVSGAGTADDSSDLFLIFAQDPPDVTNFSLTTLCQPVSGIGQHCDVDPCCIPTTIAFNQLTWDTPVSGWGSAFNSLEIQRMDTIDTEWQTIMLQTEASGAGLSLSGANSFASTPDTSVLDIVGDIDIRVDVAPDDWVSGANDYLVTKYDTNSPLRSYALRMSSTGTLQLLWSTDGITPQTRTATVSPSVFGVERLVLRATLDVDNGASGHTVAFYTGETINGPWTLLGTPVVTAGVTSIFSGSAELIIGAIDAGTAGSLPGTVYAAQVRSGINGTVVANPNFAAQANDTTTFVDSAGRVWTLRGNSVIIDGAGTTFNDFEARIGIATSYRIRALDSYGFYGDWSSTVTGTIDAPGVTIGCEGGRILTFTSNERQGGDINLAYSSVWFEQRPEEGFTFAEAGAVQLQPMYDRDYFVAFRPMERGGEQFSRTLLVQAAAISPPTLGDFTSLRDMAWEDVSYICVRDEDGNRWFSTVIVPGGRVLNSRKLYMAPIQVIEVTDVPSPVDSASVTVAGTVTSESCE